VVDCCGLVDAAAEAGACPVVTLNGAAPPVAGAAAGRILAVGTCLADILHQIPKQGLVIVQRPWWILGGRFY